MTQPRDEFRNEAAMLLPKDTADTSGSANPTTPANHPPFFPERSLTVVDVVDLPWEEIAVRASQHEQRQEVPLIESVAAALGESLTHLLASESLPGFAFDECRVSPQDRVLTIPVTALLHRQPVWFLGDIHGDMLALEAAIAFIDAEHHDAVATGLRPSSVQPLLVFLGDLIDDGEHSLAVVLHVLERALSSPGTVCLLAGNHDEALGASSPAVHVASETSSGTESEPQSELPTAGALPATTVMSSEPLYPEPSVSAPTRPTAPEWQAPPKPLASTSIPISILPPRPRTLPTFVNGLLAVLGFGASADSNGVPVASSDFDKTTLRGASSSASPEKPERNPVRSPATVPQNVPAATQADVLPTARNDEAREREMSSPVTPQPRESELGSQRATFTANVSPATFAVWLNEPHRPIAAHSIARAFITLIRRAPRALFFPDGLLVTHGGVPQTDIHGKLDASIDAWNAPEALHDFTWVRLDPYARRKKPARDIAGPDIGREDLAAFAELAARKARPVRGVVRGHDHIAVRMRFDADDIGPPVLTLNLLSQRLQRELTGPVARTPCLARWNPGAMPTVYRLLIPPSIIAGRSSAETQEPGSLSN